MSVDQQVRAAGERLGQVRVEVPDLDALLHHRHRVRSVMMSGAIVVLLVVVAASVFAVRAPGEGTVAASGLRPVVDGPIHLATSGGIWPADDELLPTLEQTTDRFASGVLGWMDASISFTPTDPPGPTWVDIERPDRSVRVLAVPVDGGWRLVQIGEPAGLTTDGTSVFITLGASPPSGAVAMRAWIETVEHGLLIAQGDSLDVPGIGVPVESVSAAIVVFLDADGFVLGAAGGDFSVPQSESSERLPTYALALSSAPMVTDEQRFPSVADSAVWTDAERQTSLTLSVRPNVGRPAPQPTGFGPMTEDPSFTGDQGRAWFTTDTGDPVRSMRMWWTRPDGALWLLSMHWTHAADGVAHSEALNQMRAWATSISRDDSDSYLLEVDGAERLAADHGGTIRERTRVWQHPAGEIVLSTFTDSVATGLTNALQRESVSIVVDDTKGWVFVDPEGRERAVAAWQRDDLWFTLIVPAELADSIEGILDGMEPEP